MPDGSSAHCTQQSPEWWDGQIKLSGRSRLGVHWTLITYVKSILVFEHRKKSTKRSFYTHYFNGCS